MAPVLSRHVGTMILCPDFRVWKVQNNSRWRDKWCFVTPSVLISGSPGQRCSVLYTHDCGVMLWYRFGLARSDKTDEEGEHIKEGVATSREHEKIIRNLKARVSLYRSVFPRVTSCSVRNIVFCR